MAIQRKIGNDLISPIGLGCMGMSEFYGTEDDEQCIKVLEHALKIGCIMWDTADVYGLGKNERLLGRVLKNHRNKVFLCTKFGIMRDPETGGNKGVSGAPEYVRACCETSLKRLGVDTIDLYYQHRIDKDTPVEETVKAMAELVKEGKVRYLGLSECSAKTLRRAHKIHPIAAIQMEYSPWTLDIEQNGVLEAARELGVAVVCYSPLGRGMMTGTIKSLADLGPNDARRFYPRFQPDTFYKNLDIVTKIEALASKKGVTPSQFVLAWVLAQGDDYFVLPGTTKIPRLDENWDARNVILTPSELSEMRKVVDEADVAGLRHSAASRKMILEQDNV